VSPGYGWSQMTSIANIVLTKTIKKALNWPH